MHRVLSVQPAVTIGLSFVSLRVTSVRRLYPSGFLGSLLCHPLSHAPSSLSRSGVSTRRRRPRVTESRVGRVNRESPTPRDAGVSGRERVKEANTVSRDE